MVSRVRWIYPLLFVWLFPQALLPQLVTSVSVLAPRRSLMKSINDFIVLLLFPKNYFKRLQCLMNKFQSIGIKADGQIVSIVFPIFS